MDNRDAHAKNLRIGRYSEPYGLYYVTKCTENHFQLSPDQRIDVLNALIRFRRKKHLLLHAFVVMPDHWHALFSLMDKWSLAKVMEGLGKHSSFNSRNTHMPLPWQAGFHDHKLRPSETVVDYIRYIENNPVRAGSVEVPGEWEWSSAREKYREHLDRSFLGHERWEK